MMPSSSRAPVAGWSLSRCCGLIECVHHLAVACKYEMLLVRRDALFVLDFGFGILSGATGIRIKWDGFIQKVFTGIFISAFLELLDCLTEEEAHSVLESCFLPCVIQLAFMPATHLLSFCLIFCE